MENEERKIIRRFPLPVMEVTENEIVYVDESNEISRFAATHAVGNPGTASLNYTAADINTKLSMVNAYAAGTFTSDSYVSLVLLATSATGDSKFDGTYLIAPYGNYNNAYDLSSAIVNFRVWVHNGIVHTCEVKCISGEIDTSKFEVIAATLKSGIGRQALFIKSNGFRGTIFVREITVNRLSVTTYLNINDPENADIKSSWYPYEFRYENVASEVIGLTNQFAIRIYQMPTSESDLMESLFGPNNNGPDGVFDLYDMIKSNIPVIIVLTLVYSDLTAITTSTNIEYDDSLDIMIFNLSFLYQGKSYHLRFALGDDGTPYPGYESVSIKTL